VNVGCNSLSYEELLDEADHSRRTMEEEALNILICKRVEAKYTS